jgi:MFS family permease
MDMLIEPAGSFGRFQKMNLFIIGLITSLSAMYYSLVILNYLEPNIRCGVKRGYDKNLTLFYHNKLKQETSVCNLWYNYTIYFIDSSNGGNNNNNEKRFYTCYFSDTFNYGLNIVTEWNLVCDHKYLATICQSLFLVGTLSAFVSEKIGSRFGRKKASLAFIGSLIIFQIICFVSISDFKMLTLKIEYRYICYCVIQFVNGILVYCMSNSTYLILIDLTTLNYQLAIAKINIYFFLFGELACLGLVYSVRNWRIVNIILTSLTILFFILFISLVPDSPR